MQMNDEYRRLGMQLRLFRGRGIKSWEEYEKLITFLKKIAEVGANPQITQEVKNFLGNIPQKDFPNFDNETVFFEKHPDLEKVNEWVKDFNILYHQELGCI